MQPPSASLRFRVDPRDVPAEKAARRLHLTLPEFERCRVALYERGFPAPDPTTGMYDLHAIDRWMDARHEQVVANASLTAAAVPRNADDVFGERRRERKGGQG
jgi:hypothetical protein